jgi:hypothetical protein
MLNILGTFLESNPLKEGEVRKTSRAYYLRWMVHVVRHLQTKSFYHTVVTHLNENTPSKAPATYRTSVCHCVARGS